jgi:hypothetical protein
MPADAEPLVLRNTWNRFDKVWWLGSTLFWGLPCAALMTGFGAAEIWWALAIAGAAWIAFGIIGWRVRSRDGGTLQAEVTRTGIRFTEKHPPTPWTEIARVGVRHTPSGTFGPQSHDYVVLHLTDGTHQDHQVDIHLAQVIPAIRRLAPQIPLSANDRTPPP